MTFCNGTYRGSNFASLLSEIAGGADFHEVGNGKERLKTTVTERT